MAYIRIAGLAFVAVLATHGRSGLPNHPEPIGVFYPPDVHRIPSQLGITPHALAASGANAASAAGILARLAAAEELLATLSSARSNCSTFMRDVQSLEQARSLPGAHSNLEQQLAEARSHLTEATAARIGAENALRAEALGDLSSGAKALLAIQQQNSRASLPPEFKVVGWNAHERKVLELAVAAERLAAISHRELASEHQTVLAAARARSEVIAAKASLIAHQAEIRAVFAGQ